MAGFPLLALGSVVRALVESVAAAPAAGVRVWHAQPCEGPAASQMTRLMEALEEHDDVQNVYSNFDVDENELEALA